MRFRAFALFLIVGLFTDMMDNRGKGYLFDGSRFTPFEVPGASSTAAWDINPGRVVVGVYRDGAGFHGFTYNGDVEMVTTELI